MSYYNLATPYNRRYIYDNNQKLYNYTCPIDLNCKFNVTIAEIAGLAGCFITKCELSHTLEHTFDELIKLPEHYFPRITAEFIMEHFSNVLDKCEEINELNILACITPESLRKWITKPIIDSLIKELKYKFILF